MENHHAYISNTAFGGNVEKDSFLRKLKKNFCGLIFFCIFANGYCLLRRCIGRLDILKNELLTLFETNCDLGKRMESTVPDHIIYNNGVD